MIADFKYEMLQKCAPKILLKDLQLEINELRDIVNEPKEA